MPLCARASWLREQPVEEAGWVDLGEPQSAPVALQQVGGGETERAGGLHGHSELVGLVGVGDRERASTQRAVGIQQAGCRLGSERGGQCELRGSAGAGQHPHVGALDVAPIVYVDPNDRGAACAHTLVLGDRIGAELHVPVLLYGELSGTEPETARTRAQLRRGGVAGLAARMAADEDRLVPDFGPSRLHASAGATLIAARPPLVAFNLQLASAASLEDASAIAALIRDGGEHGLPGVRAIGVALDGGVAQVSMNVERPLEVPLAVIVHAVRAHAEVASAELVGLAPAAAFEGFPPELPIPGFDPARHLIENALGC